MWTIVYQIMTEKILHTLLCREHTIIVHVHNNNVISISEMILINRAFSALFSHRDRFF